MGRWAILNGVLVLIVLLLGLQIARTWGRTLPPVEVATRQTRCRRRRRRASARARAAATRRGGKRGAPEKAEQQPAVLVTTIVNKDLFDPSRQKPTEEVKAAPREGDRAAAEPDAGRGPDDRPRPRGPA